MEAKVEARPVIRVQRTRVREPPDGALPVRSTSSRWRRATSIVFYGEKQALFDVSLDIPDRSVTAFIGPSGCGKSTFLRCLNRMNDTIEGCRVTGDIELDGEDIYSPQVDPVQLRARVGMVFQKPNPFPKSIFENVAYGPRIHGLATSKADLDEIVVNSLQKGRPVRGGQGPARTSPAPGFPAASSSGSASPAPSRSTRRSSSWTSPARRSTRSPPRASRS